MRSNIFVVQALLSLFGPWILRIDIPVMVNQMKCILLFVASLQKGFFVSVANLMNNHCRVVFVASADDVKDEIMLHIPNAEVVVRRRPSESKRVDLEEVRRLEEDYGETFSMLIAKDRALGHGYLFNVDSYPPARRKDWESGRKYAYLKEEFAFYEDLCAQYKPALALTIAIHEVQHLVFSKMQVPVFALGLIKFGSRLFWYDSPKYTNGRVREMLAENLSKDSSLDCCNAPTYAMEKSAHAINSKIRFTYFQAIKEAAYQVTRDVLRLSGLRSSKMGGYKFGAWVPVIFRKVRLYRYFQTIGVTPAALSGRKIIFVPLQVEPEISLLSVSPEFNNSMEMVAWLSKAAPADCVIVVKEHLTCLGHRSIDYYDRLRSLPNVCVARLNLNSWDWIKASALVATITGTAGIEAVYFGRPVLSFGAHQLVNLLPTVRFASCFDATRRALTELLAINLIDYTFNRSRAALHEALIGQSFEFPGFEASWKSTVLDLDRAALALRHLRATADGLDEIFPANLSAGSDT